MFSTMPFGKHQGKPLTAIPSSYLCWLVGLPDLEPWLLRAVQEELGQRGLDWEVRPPTAPLAWPSLLGQVRRRLAMEHHPDRGGSIEKMAGINLALDAVENELTAAGR